MLPRALRPDVQTGQLPGEPRRYFPRRAERYAREALIPPAEFAASAHRADHQLADQFGVPIEQIAQRRRDLAGQLAALPRPRRRSNGRRLCQRAGGRGTIPLR